METKKISWDRQKLYDEVWARPIRTVAREYGLSDVGLAKICEKLHIPRPGLGYWRRKECGYESSQPPLPELKQRFALISQVPVAPPATIKQPEEQFPQLKDPTVNTARHPLVKLTQHAFLKGGTDQFGRLRPSDWRLPHLNIRVTRAGLQRALDLLDGLIKLLEANDMKF